MANEPTTNVNTSPSSSSSDKSTTEDERLKILFDSCDHDGDGYLDRQDFVFMCLRLNMADCADELMHQLGLSHDRLISFDDFIQYKRKVVLESSVEFARRSLDYPGVDRVDASGLTRMNEQFSRLNERYSQTVDGQFTLRRDGDPVAASDMQYSVHADVPCGQLSSWLTMSSDNSLGAQSGKPDSADYDSGARDLSPEPVTSNLVKVQGHGMYEDGASTAMQMSTRLKGGLGELTNQLLQLTTDRDLLEHRLNQTQEECQDRVEQTVTRYEERIIELHSVIAELRKKIERRNANVIHEEDEFDEEGSGSDAERGSSIDGDVPGAGFCSPGCGGDASRHKPSIMLHDRYSDGVNIYQNLISNLDSSQSFHRPMPSPSTDRHSPPLHRPPLPPLPCQAMTYDRDTRPDNDPTQPLTPRSPINDSLLRNQEVHQGLKTAESPATDMSSQSLLTQDRQFTADHRLTKIAELKKLKPAQSFGDSAPHAQWSQEGPGLKDRRARGVDDRSLDDEWHEQRLVNERLRCSLAHANAQNDVMALTLEESRTQSERLSVLIGKYESNNTALQLAVSYADQALEASDVFGAYQEAEQGLLLANCRAAGLGAEGDSSARHNQDEISGVLLQAQASHKAAGHLARHLLHKLDANNPPQLVAPWQDYSSTSSTTSSADNERRSEKQQLRDFIDQLKRDRAAVGMTVMELESVHIDPCLLPPGTALSDPAPADLELALLLQELMLAKEEKAELKAHNYLLDKERRAIELKLSGKESQERAYMVQIDQLKSEVGERALLDQLDTTTRDQNSQVMSQGHELAESLKRERKLKHRVQELVATLEKLSRNSETRHQQSADFIADLKRANSALISAFEKAKKKYQSKIKKLEAHLENITEASHTQMSLLKQRISQLEAASQRRLPNETSL